VALVPKLVGGYGLGMLYDKWVGCGMPARADEILARQFSDGVAERVERAGSVRGFEAGLTAPSPWPGEALSTATDYDQYVTGLVSRFRESPTPFRQLDKRRHQLLFIGHTHRPGRQPLHRMTRGIERQVYLNTGSWTRDTERPVYGFAEVTARGVDVGLAELG
jgi:hypothetical protein